MPNQTVTITSASTSPSTPCALNWRSGKPASVSVVSAATTSSATFSIQITLDDLQIVGGTSRATWQGLSSATGGAFQSTAAAASVFAASGLSPDGLFFSLAAPVAAVRLTQVTSVNGGPVFLRVMQGEGG